MNLWHARLFYHGKEHNEDASSADAAKAWVERRLEKMGHTSPIEWLEDGPGWRAGSTPDFTAYVQPR